MLHGFLAWEAGTIRLYPANSSAEAARLFDQFENFAAIMQVLVITRTTVLLRGALACSDLDRRSMRAIAEQLYQSNFLHAVMEREGDRQVPGATKINKGPFAGLWHLDLAHIIAGKLATNEEAAT